MTKEELAALIAEAVKPLADQVTALQKTTSGALDANKETRDRIATHANALRACASGMEAAGIGLHGTHGHVAHLNRMAASMEAEAASGKVPHIYRDHDWVISAGAELRQFEAGATPAVDLSKDPTMKALTDSLAKLTTQVTDLSAARFQASQEPARRTLHTEHLALLRKTGLTVEDGKKISVSDLDAAAEKAGLPRQQSIALKLAMQASGHLDA